MTRAAAPFLRPMTRLSAFLLALALPGMAHAACYADYKASRDDPFRLHYGVIALAEDDPCTVEAAEAALEARLADGWRLLQVEGVFGEDDLDRRRDSAGDFYLRF